MLQRRPRRHDAFGLGIAPEHPGSRKISKTTPCKVAGRSPESDKAERARLKFIETQVLIDAIDRAIAGERVLPAAA